MTVATREAAVQITRHRFTADQYQRMGEAGVFHPNDRVELINGEIVEMAAMGARHVACIGATTEVISRQVRGRAVLLPQCAIRIADDGEPQPDFTIASLTYDRNALPTPVDTFLVIEVSDSSLAFDRRIKLPLYGAAGIPESWIFDLTNNRIERHTGPHASGYGAPAVAGPGERLTSTTLPDLAFDVDEVLGLPPKR